jgi:hypothetical protein
MTSATSTMNFNSALIAANPPERKTKESLSSRYLQLEGNAAAMDDVRSRIKMSDKEILDRFLRLGCAWAAQSEMRKDCSF